MTKKEQEKILKQLPKDYENIYGDMFSREVKYLGKKMFEWGNLQSADIEELYLKGMLEREKAL